MAIIVPEDSVLSFLRAFRDAGDFARGIQSGSGGLLYAEINRLQEAAARLDVAYLKVQEDALINQNLVVSMINARGGPSTASAVQSSVSSFKTAMSSWRALVLSEVQALSGADLFDIRSQDLGGGVFLRTINGSDRIPQSVADSTLRPSVELANVVGSLQTFGA